MLDSGVHPKTNTACPEFVPIPDEPVVLKRAPIPENYQVIDGPEPKRQPVKSCHYKPRNTLVVDVPLDNPDLAVVELRHQLGEEYLDQCFAAWRTLKTSD